MIRIRTTAALALATLLLAGQASATTWNPTDIDQTTGDVNVLNISTSGTGLFGIFDAGTLPGAGAPGISIAGFDTIVFNLQGNGTWELTNLAGDTFNLGTSTAFQFGYFDGASWIEDTMAAELGAAGSNIWVVAWDGALNVAITAVDVRPVPVPAALWLFASGILGLVTLRRRN